MVAERQYVSIEGLVRAANSKGIRLDGQSDWLNWSKFATATATPAPGNLIAAKLDSAGFLREIEVLDDHNPSVAAPQFAQPTPEAPKRSLVAPDKDRMIARMNTLTTATAILSSGGRACNGTDVMNLASILEQHILRWY